ncbi:MAG TPA: MFS transporter [candidate division Zixibacteria bacterium]|nr:MFS transporter [candidate division Zixibacteria bacterium]
MLRVLPGGRALEALQYREFRLLWYGQMFTAMATWMDSIARGWLIYELTSSSFQLGLVRGVQAIPTLLLSPVAGSAADLYSRKTQILIAQVVDGLLYAWIAAMILTGHILPWHVYVTSVGLATVQAFQLPSRTAMVSDSVPAGCLTNAMGLNAVVFNSARSLGPALAGILISLYGTAGSYSVQAGFYLLATIWTAMLRPREQPPPARGAHGGHGASFRRSIVEGWKFSWTNYEVRVSLLVVSIAMFLLIPFTTLLPVFARDILEVGAHGQGMLLTAMGVGALFSSVLVAFVGDKVPRGPVMIGGVGLYGLLLAVFSFSASFALSIATMFLVGLCHVTSHALIQIVIQSYSPSEFRGRTMAIFHMTQVILVVGAMFVGALASAVGARWALSSMSLTATAAMVGIYALMPRAREIR